MNIPSDIEEKLGFDEIRSFVLDKCRSTGGKKLGKKLAFSTNINVVKMWLQQTHEFQQLLTSGSVPPITEIDISEGVEKLQEKHSVLAQHDFVDLRVLCQDIVGTIEFFSEKEEKTPSLYALIQDLESPAEVIERISSVFDDFGDWKRDASPLLRKILDLIDANEKEAYSIIKRIYNSAASNKWTAETDVSIKDGRLVIPIYAEHKKKVRGIMHDESGGGKILYIEPIEVLEAANKQKELELDRDREIHRILTELTQFVKLHLTDIKTYSLRMSILDFVRAKARLAIDLDASFPVITNIPNCSIKEMYHPLLYLTNKQRKKPTIPMNIELSDDQRLVVISGPNAGGKSVTIKTLALNQYMLQCGVLPCASPESSFGFYKQIFVDIGDNQSIENDLSSYSSHLTAMKQFLAKANDKTLLIIDEIGSGTDPNFGGAMAEAILLQLNKLKPRGAVTTHFGNVKSLAKTESGFINASMLYDTDKLQPKYEFRIGKPGSSFALEVAQNIGLPSHIIKGARKRSNIKQQKTDELLATLESERLKLKESAAELEASNKHLTSLKSDYTTLKKELETNRNEILISARKKASELIEGANAEIERTIKSIKESKADKKVTSNARKSLSNAKVRLSKSGQTEGKGTPEVEMRPITVGSQVRIPNSSSTGEVIQLRKDKAVVLAGIMKSTYPISDLKLINQKSERKKAGKVSVGFVNRQEQFSMEKDVRGLRAEEAIKEIDRWIDDAIVIGMTKLRLIHGKGDGILKQLIRDYYHSAPFVKRITYEDVRMGGEGVSLIELA